MTVDRVDTYLQGRLTVATGQNIAPRYSAVTSIHGKGSEAYKSLKQILFTDFKSAIAGKAPEIVLYPLRRCDVTFCARERRNMKILLLVEIRRLDCSYMSSEKKQVCVAIHLISCDMTGSDITLWYIHNLTYSMSDGVRRAAVTSLAFYYSRVLDEV